MLTSPLNFQSSKAMVAPLDDVGARLARIGAEPRPVLDEPERISRWLQRKASRRIWEASTLRRTKAMTRTPRRVLEERALLGNWSAFLESPAPHYAALKSAVGQGYYDYRGTAIVVLSLETTAARCMAPSASDLQRLAIHRGMLSAAIEAMAQVDDSLAELAEHFREHEHAYLALLLPPLRNVLLTARFARARGLGRLWPLVRGRDIPPRTSERARTCGRASA